ncbi:MAG TPA: chemotaxis protein CheW [Gemmatimonadales bacterium]|jgi:purine-binding chemotaxis protein CheW|nr:chemotaxis protein CheW [Gemmatimonadales bacterium]
MSDALLRFADELGAAGPAEVAAPVAELHLVTFTLDREAYGVPVQRVREVIRVGEITRVPQAPEHVRGVTNLRGRILPVVELRSRLGLTPAVLTPRSRIVVTEAHGRILGLLVDAVLQVTRIPADTVQPAPEDIRTPEADWLAGVARRPDRLLILLDLDAVLLLQR